MNPTIEHKSPAAIDAFEALKKYITADFCETRIEGEDVVVYTGNGKPLAKLIIPAG